MQSSPEAGDRRKTLILVGVLLALFVLALLLVRRATDDVGADRASGVAHAAAQLDAGPAAAPFDAGAVAPVADVAPAAPLASAPPVIPFDAGAEVAPAPRPSSSAPKCIPESRKEFCGDGVDNNCDGQIDEGCPRR